MSRRAAALLVLMFLALLPGCESDTGAPSTNSQTHWLRSCEADADCEDALSCLCGVCTRACEATEACAGLDGEAVCASPEAAQATEACGAAGATLPAVGLCLPPPPGGDAPEQLCGTRGAALCPAGEFCNWSEAAICGAADQPGLCRPLPAACDQVFEPVCGCDDQTYGNACEAAAAGVSVLSKGECAPDEPPGEIFCGGFGALACPAGQFCFYGADAICGADDGGGVCRLLPETCPEIFAPVCGCDGQIYESECRANGAGVSVAPAEWCDRPPVEVACGARAGDSCAPDQFCAYQEGDLCGAADAEAICRPRPEVCPEVILPVCGCDNQTWSNDCEANASGVGVLHGGECDSPDNRTCGGFAGLPCERGEFCDYALGDGCGIADALGACRLIPEVCTQEVAPVCGCDGQTYGNACMANAAGVSVLSEGECR
jgi:hypothetical protein